MNQTAEKTCDETARMAVHRALSHLRRGKRVVVLGRDGRGYLVQSAETGEDAVLPELVVTHRRAQALNLETGDDPAVIIKGLGLDEDAVKALSDPCARRPAVLPATLSVSGVGAGDARAIGIQLTKTAGLLPAITAKALPEGDCRAWAADHCLPHVAAEAVTAFQGQEGLDLKRAVEARVPLAGAEDARVTAFRSGNGDAEHLAITIGRPDFKKPVLTRLHSECFTGDLLGSLRCDCGDQLRGAITAMAEAGGGVLLYLAQEGRGIGLVNKLRAYQLQDRGFDTLEANGQLGFEEDERVYQPAAEMLRQLGVRQVRLLTNNPAKMEALARHGIEVTERVPHIFPPNSHNAAYLKTKADKGGHFL